MIQKLDEELYRVLQKCATYPEFADSSLHEGSIRHLIVEELEPSDIKSVQRNLEKTKAAVVKTREYVDKFQLQDELQLMYDYMEGLERGLDRASKELVNVSFDSGVLSNFFGKKFSLPQLTAAAIELNTKAVDFASGFHKAMEKIQRILIPALKNSDPKLTVSDAAADDETLDLNKIQQGIQKILEKDLTGTLLQKVKGFFKMPAFGKSREILNAPELNVDMGMLSRQIADELVNAKIENLLGQAPPKGPDADLVTNLEDEMKDVVSDDDVNTEAGKPAETSPGAEPEAPGAEPEAPEAPEGAADQGSQPSTAYKLSQQDLKTIKAAMDKAKSGKKSQTKALGSTLNAILGKSVFSENRVYNLLQVISESSKSKELNSDRWQKMAGLLK